MLRGVFQNGTYHFLFELSALENVFQMLGDGGPLHTKKLCHALLGEPEGFIIAQNFHLHLAIGRGVEEEVCDLVCRAEFFHG